MSVRKNSVAWLALFIALGGTSYAATQLPANSVGARQLKNGAVTDAKVRQHSLTARAFATGALPTLRTEVVSTDAAPPGCGPNGCAAQAGISQTWTAPCPPRTKVVGGGYAIPEGQASDEVASASEPVGAEEGEPPVGAGGGWEATFTMTQSASAPVYGYGTIYAVCVSVR